MMDFLIQKAYAADLLGGGTTPTGLLGENTTNNSNFEILLGKILNNVVDPIIYLLMALAVIYFLWGVVVFIKEADNAEKRKEGYQQMIWGIIGLFIMLSARGIIALMLSTMGLLK